MEPDNPKLGCKLCGTPLVEETIGGLCPRCLLEMNFASRTMPGGEPSPQIPPPSPEEMAARFPQFEILECLGRGGMGIVYKARQKTLDRLVAIKVLAGERRDDPQFEERFSREARTLAKLSHPNIVTVHDFGESDGMFYLVMEFVDGVNLRDVLRDGRMEPAQALAIVPSICEALQFAHDHGVVHRDIKPENILMDRDGRVKIADFGIATLVGAAAERSGTPPYMAPEQESADGAIDHRADIYALGVVFYEMLTGERPEQDPSRPSQRVEIDVRLDEIVLRALEKEPEQRYQTAGEFRTMVETVAAPAEGAASADRSGMKLRFSRAALLEFLRRISTKYNRSGLAIMALGGLIVLGAIANFHFMFGVEESSMLLAGAILMGFGVLAAVLGKNPARSDSRTSASQATATFRDHGSQDKRNGWELATIVFGTLFLVLFSAFTWEWSGPLRVPLIVICALGLIICALSLAGVWPFPSPIFPEPNFSSRNMRCRWVRVSIFGCMALAVVLTALSFWLQRPRRVDEPNIAATSPDGMYDAMGQTWHEMRIFGGDRTFYRFIIQGKAGAVWEKWDVEVPYDHLATSYVLLSRDEILFGKHGRIVWSEDGKRASFRVNGIEVAGFDTETGKPIVSAETQNTPQQVARAFMDAYLSGNVDKARSLIGPPMSDHHPDHLAMDLSNSDGLRLGNPSFETWHVEEPYAVTPVTVTLPGGEGNHASCMVLRRSGDGWRVIEFVDATADSSLADELGRFRQSLEDENRPPTPDRIMKQAQLPDVDRRDVPTVLDLASGEMLAMPPVEDEGEILGYFNKLGMGDLAWDQALITLRGARLNEWNENGVWDLPKPVRKFQDCASYRFDLPKRLLVTTAEDTCYTIDVSAGVEGGVRVDYQRGNVPPEAGNRLGAAEGGDPPSLLESSGHSSDPVSRVKALLVTPPVTMPEGWPITVEQAKKILEKVTWGEFIAKFADDGHEHEVSWKEVPTNGGNGLRIEVSFRFGGEKMRLDFEVDPAFRQVTPSRLRSAGNPEQVMVDASEFLPVMVLRYAAESKHPDAAAVVEKVMSRARQVMDRSIMRQYGVALMVCKTDTGSFPENLQVLVDRKYVPELMPMLNHKTGKMEPPLYHRGLDVRKVADPSQTIVLAAPSANPAGKRIVGFLDSHVAEIDEADYQAQLKAQQKVPEE